MASNAYEKITDWIVKEIDRGTVPWQRPWNLALGSDGQSGPFNLKGTPYRGINRLILGLAPYACPFWVTFKGAKDAGGTVKRGERGRPICFFQWYDKRNEDTGKVERFPVLRSYSVFNAEAQCEGVKVPEWTIKERPEFEAIEAAEAIAKGYAGAPPIEEGGDRACYSPELDRVRMPERWQFDKPAGYYETLFHELGHSTGHKSRLDRKFGASFGDHLYSREEIVAELCSAFLCHEAGLARETRENSAAYLDNWRKALKADSRCVVMGAAQAQKAADWILGHRRNAEGE